MKRHATLNLDGFDPEIIEAARDVARRAGVPVEAWIASIVSPEAKPKHRRRRTQTEAQTRAVSGRSPTEAKSSIEVESLAEAKAPPPAADLAPAVPRQEAPVAPAPVPDPASVFTTSIAEMMRRLDAIDHTIAREHQVSQEAATRSIAGIEARISTVLDAGLTPAAQMAERLALIERRMTELGEQLSSPRPIGRRGRPAETEVRDAVAEIRQRQRELDSGQSAASGARASQSGGVSPLRAPSPAITELQLETTRLRESIGGLATGRDVSALEQAMRSLVTGVQRAQEPGDLAAIAAPIELIRVQVARLADDVAENVHARVANDVERLAAKVDGALSGGTPGFADRDALGDLFRELDEIRRLIGALAGPERIQSLAHGLQAISGQISQLQGGVASDGASMAELRPILEEIRTGLRAPSGGGIEEQIQAMGVKLDALREGASTGGDAQSDAILGRIDALADKVDRVSANPVGDLIGRLENLGETLRHPVVPGGDLASIHGMLHDLAEKLDRVGGSPSPRAEGLDALEKQVLALASRIDTRDADPALAGLERTMSDLLAQVSALRDEAPIEAAVERATRNAVAESIGNAPESGEIGLLRAGLADLRAQQAASEQRMQATLDGVHTALDRLVGRLGVLAGDTPGDRRIAPDDLAERLSAATTRVDERVPPQASAAAQTSAAAQISTAAQVSAAGHVSATAQPGPAIRRPDAVRAALSAQSVDLGRVSDQPLEPGARRPGRDRPAETASGPVPSSSDGDIKTSFIAAARRAAQAAQNEAAGTGASFDIKSKVRGGTAEPRSAEPAARGARLRAELDKRRKPLLLGLAAIVLALGALQAINTRRVDTDAAPQVASGPPNATAPQGPDAVAASAPMARPAEAPERPDPQTTQSIVEAAPAPNAPAAPAADSAPQKPSRHTVPRLAGLSGLAGDLGAVPTGLAQLRKSALDGDGGAVYDLASRAADGRGMPRDFSVAAKLFEKLAEAGYAPAQYKLGGLYEKGSGVVRDITQAKLWYGRAAEQGHARSMHNMAVIYAENPSPTGKPDFATASQWFRRGAEYGMRDSQYNLAVLYARGLGVQQDLTQSYLWFAAAAAQGDDAAAKKRDDVAAKLAPEDLARARSLTLAFKAKVPEPAVNEPPAMASTAGTVTLLGAPPPSTPSAPARRAAGV